MKGNFRRMCTNIKLHTKDNKWVTGRTNEFSGVFLSRLVYLPREYEIDKFLLNPKFGKMKQKHAMIGLSPTTAKQMGFEFSEDTFIDGMNEFGLSVSLLYFPVVFKWKTVKTNDVTSEQVSGYNFANYILGNCKNSKEAREFISANKENIVILEDGPYPVSGLHFAIVDASGDSFVVEPEGGELIIKENPAGVLTNSPRLEWHQENLATYLHLQSKDKVVNARFFDKHENPLMKRSMGNGAVGLPGDWTATSRFIRTTFLVQNANVAKNEIEAVNQCFRILNTSDIVAGTVTMEVPEKIINENKILVHGDQKNHIADITDNVVVKDLSNKIFYWKTANNIAPRFAKFSDYIKSDKRKSILIDQDKSFAFQEVKLV